MGYALRGQAKLRFGDAKRTTDRREKIASEPSIGVVREFRLVLVVWRLQSSAFGRQFRSIIQEKFNESLSLAKIALTPGDT